MATPATGAISMSQVRAEAGLTGQISFGNVRVRRMMMRTLNSGDTYLSQAPRLGDARATRYLPDGQTWQSIRMDQQFGYPTVATNFKFIIPPGSRVGGGARGWAIIVGNGWAAGSYLNIVNWGNILGGYGSIGQGSTGGAGEQGGSCIHAAYSNVWTSLYNKPGGQVYGGGGGGGKGGTGGRGGKGGDGYYVATNQEGPSAEQTTHGIYRFNAGPTYWKWHAGGRVVENYFSTAGDGTDQVNVGGDRYYRGGSPGTGFDPVFGAYVIYEIMKQYDYNVYTSGGGGGWGGLGGDGGFGQGFDHVQTGPTQGGLAGGSGGSGPNGQNAGWGGTGGRGGDGGWGGGWGQYGATGGTGYTGENGGYGNIQGVIGGEGGSGGSPGGPPGYYLYLGGRGGLSNEGAVAGLFAG